jgi:putative transcriptional regulator
MKDDLFRDLEASVREGGAILRGERSPARAFVVGDPDVKVLRNSFRLSQVEFAAMIGISVKTLRNWEQGRRQPAGPARVLLQVAARHPEAVWDAAHPAISRHEESASTIRRNSRGTRTKSQSPDTGPTSE